ncbi:MAG: hypothetical protein DCC75_02340 [Proteobacteria bacterium]|nr:MAG: hypothetical protein DCC75_02340 [Pseudomonadota bacterium]
MILLLIVAICVVALSDLGRITRIPFIKMACAGGGSSSSLGDINLINDCGQTAPNEPGADPQDPPPDPDPFAPNDGDDPDDGDSPPSYPALE